MVLTPHSANIGDSGGALRRHHVSEPPPTNLGLQEPRRVGARSDRSNQICECTCRNQGHDHLVSLIYRVGPESVGKGRKRPSLQRSESGSRRKTHATKHGNSITKTLCMRTMVHNSAEIGTYVPARLSSVSTRARRVPAGAHHRSRDPHIRDRARGQLRRKGSVRSASRT